MQLPWGDDRTVTFITNVGLVTSDGPHGPNVMACEWTHQVSYEPGLVAVCLGKGKATLANIRATKEFGVSLAATDQNVLASVAGGSSGRDVNKIAALKSLGFTFSKAKHIKALLVDDAAVTIECKLFKEIELGDHTMLVGEILAARQTPGKEPLAYHKGAYWAMRDRIPKPSEDERTRIRHVVEKHRKLSGNR
ncbi:MAG: flavin reductase family protein [Candidatus Aenigmarchaeota archaeon]|nr:flavin reductase family protein [Candidatus Aenigmarchaeota archaeon]